MKTNTNNTMNTNKAIVIRAKTCFNMCVRSWEKGNMETYDKYHGMLKEMVRDGAVSKEFLRDLYGSISVN